METTSLLDLIVNNGLGVAAFIALIYFGRELLKGVTKFMTNDWHHFVESMDAKLDKIIDLLEKKK